MSDTIKLKIAQSEHLDWQRINPLIDSDGDCYRVSTVLEMVSKMFNQHTAIALDEVEAYGVSLMLSTCAAALRKINDINQS